MKANRFLIVLMCLLVSCSSEPAITTYAPPQESPLKITFQYPDNWEWHQGNTVSSIGAKDPYYPDNRDRGIVIVRVVVTETPDKYMREAIELFSDSPQDKSSRIKSLAEEKLEVDGYFAQRFIRTVSPLYRLGETVASYSEIWLLLSKDRYYVLSFSIPESEVDGRFHQEFKALVESIQFLP